VVDVRLAVQLRHLQWLQRHSEAGSSWPSWPKASYDARWRESFC